MPTGCSSARSGLLGADAAAAAAAVEVRNPGMGVRNAEAARIPEGDPRTGERAVPDPDARDGSSRAGSGSDANTDPTFSSDTPHVSGTHPARQSRNGAGVVGTDGAGVVGTDACMRGQGGSTTPAVWLSGLRPKRCR